MTAKTIPPEISVSVVAVIGILWKFWRVSCKIPSFQLDVDMTHDMTRDMAHNVTELYLNVRIAPISNIVQCRRYEHNFVLKNKYH